MSNSLLLNSLRILDKYKYHGVSEIMVNKPGEVWVDQAGTMQKYEDSNITPENIKNLTLNIAGTAGQELSKLRPMVSATLPNYIVGDVKKGGERVQVVRSPIVPVNQTAIALRIPSTKRYSMDEYRQQGAFEQIGSKSKDIKLKALYEKKNWDEFIVEAVKTKKNIINSGGTSTGKTTFTNTLTSLMGINERIITIEDSREIQAPQPNQLNLLTSSEKKDANNNIISPAITPRQLIAASLRLRPDRIIMGELRESEAFDFLRAINSGHPGSITTIHSDTAKGALEVLKQLVMQAGMGWDGKEIKGYIKSVIDVVIQWQRYGDKRVVSEVWWKDAP